MWGQIIAAAIGTAIDAYSDRQDRKVTQDQITNQKEFAQHGIRWKVQDARQAGIHPLAALGASTHSYSPVSVGRVSRPNYGAYASDIARAIESNPQVKEETRGRKLDNSIKAEQLKQMKLETKLRSKQTIPGQGNEPISFTEGVTGNPPDYINPTVPLKSSHGVQSGIQPMHQFAEDSDGYLWKFPSKEIQEALSEGPPLTQIQYGVKQMSDYLGGNLAKLNPRSPVIQKTIQRLKNERPWPANPRYEFRFHARRGQWKRVLKDGTNSLFLHPELNQLFWKKTKKVYDPGLSKSH